MSDSTTLIYLNKFLGICFLEGLNTLNLAKNYSYKQNKNAV